MSILRANQRMNDWKTERSQRKGLNHFLRLVGKREDPEFIRLVGKREDPDYNEMEDDTIMM